MRTYKIYGFVHDLIDRILYPAASSSTKLSNKFSSEISPDGIIVYNSKVKHLNRILFVLIVLMILYFIARFGSNQKFVDLINIEVRIELFIGIIFFIIISDSIFKYFDKSPKLIINKQGIAVKNKLISWDSIEGTYIQNIVQDINLLRRISIKTKDRKIKIWANYLTIDHDEISHFIELYKNKFGSAQQQV